MEPWIRQSNLIEDVDDADEDARSSLAWEWLKDRPFTIYSVLSAHKRIMWHKLGADAGRFRTCQVWVGGREGSDWQKVPELMAEWIKTNAMKSLTQDEIKICLAHIAFEKIHPFIDGNGRVGRMVMNWQRRHAGLTPLMIEASERRQYYAWFCL